MKLLLLIILVLSSFSILSACDMFALILSPNENFSDHQTIVEEYFNFLISRSNASLNRDGYGIVAYKRSLNTLSESDVWYKTGSNSWYGDGQPDPLDEARTAILSEDYFLVIAHARRSNGGSGSHPFRVNVSQSTYSLCHNGVINGSLKQAMMNFLGETWFEMHPSNWSGEFGDLGSFIDSELYTHYLVKRIIDNMYNTREGLISAYYENDLLGVDAADYFLNAKCSANMLFSDGDALYAFRNTKTISSQILSWSDYGDIIGIRTQTALNNELKQNELIRFGKDGTIVSEILLYSGEEDFVPATDFYSQPNPFHNEVDIYYVMDQRVDPDNEEASKPDEIIIYDLKGRKIRKLNNFSEINGYRGFHWDGRNRNGSKVASGMYFYHHSQSGKTGKLIYIN